jgi:hypothetical protein
MLTNAGRNWREKAFRKPGLRDPSQRVAGARNSDVSKRRYKTAGLKVRTNDEGESEKNVKGKVQGHGHLL